jgi:prefoldin subunit 5
VHENPTAEDELEDVTAQLQQLQSELAEAQRKMEQLEDARKKVGCTSYDRSKLQTRDPSVNFEEHIILFKLDLLL